MKEPSDDPPLLDRIRSWTRSKSHVVGIDPFAADNSNRRDHPVLPIANPASKQNNDSHDQPAPSADDLKNTDSHPSAGNDAQATQPSPASRGHLAPNTLPMATEHGEKSTPVESESAPQPLALTVFQRILRTTKVIILSSWINWLLLFVPVGLALGGIHRSMGDESPISPTVVFSMNAIAIIPLASLLGFATESVASKLGDKIGALMNVTFGNAVELIILYVSRLPPRFSAYPCST